MIIRRSSIFISVVMLLAACGSPKGPVTSGSGVAPDAVGAVPDAPVGLQFTLSEVESPAVTAEAPPRAQVEPLDDAALRAVLARAPKWKPKSARAGATEPIETERVPPRVRQAEPVQIQAGVAPEAAAAAAGPLKVLRFSPEGEVEMATTVSVTFSQPMVPLTTHGAAAENVPVRLEPQPPGRWRWIGTDTVLFEADGRFPMATEYQVVVPAGTAAQSGATLQKEIRFEFATPVLRLQDNVPYWEPAGSDRWGVTDLRPFVFLGFNQRVDPSEVLEHVTLRSSQGAVELEMARVGDVPADNISLLHKLREPTGTWLLLRPEEPLLPTTNYSVALNSGAPSAEGDRVTTQQQKFRFKTFEALRIDRVNCGYTAICRPGNDWTIRFNNPLDESVFDPGSIIVEPPIRDKDVSIGHQRIIIRGATRAQSRYRVTVPSEVKDRFGQTLGQAETFTMEVGASEPRLENPGDTVVVLPPGEPAAIDFYAQNVKNIRARVFSAEPRHLNEYLRWVAGVRDERWDERDPELPPGKPIADRSIPELVPGDEMGPIPIDLSGPLVEGADHLIVWLTSESADPTEEPRIHDATVWVQRTDLRIDAYSDDDELIAWVTRVSDGRPVHGARVRLTNQRARDGVATDVNGLARLSLPGEQDGENFQTLTAQLDEDEAFSAFWYIRTAIDRDPIWSVNTDRGIYRPGEKIHLHGWVRYLKRASGADLRLPGQQERKVAWQLEFPHGEQKREGTLKLTKNGGFELLVDIPANVSLGQARFVLALESKERGQHTEWFQIQEYRRPEYEVRVESEPGPHYLGTRVALTADAAYYSGGSLGSAPIVWRVDSGGAKFVPPGLGRFQFGRHRPFWRQQLPAESTEVVRELVGITDSRGRHSVQLALDGMHAIEPMTVVARATVEDLNRQNWESRKTLLVHPSRYYVGLHVPFRWTTAGTEIPVEWVVADVDGVLLPEIDGHLEFFKIEHEQDKNGWREVRRSMGSCEGRSKLESAGCSFRSSEPGDYLVNATVLDPEGRRNESELRIFLTDPGGEISQFIRSDEEVTIVADRAEYVVGNTAQLMIASTKYPVTGLLTVMRNGLVETRVVSIDGPSQLVELPLTDSHHPQIHVRLDLVGPGGSVIEESPQLTLAVKNPFRELKVAAQAKHLRSPPGGKNEIAIEVRGTDGLGVKGAEVTVFIVDESLLSLTGHEFKFPENSFYARRSRGTFAYPFFAEFLHPADREHVLGLDHVGGRTALNLMTARSAPGRQTKISMRQDFRPLAAFRANVKTDATGRVKVDFKMPDSLTRYRVVALAAAGADRFGSAESTITASLPLMVRPSPPRFAHLDDAFELPVVLHNASERPLEVQVAGRARGIAFGEAGADRLGYTTRVPAGGRVEVAFPARATDVGEASFQFVAAAGNRRDGYAARLPVQLPTKMETFATFGVIDKGAVRHKIDPPAGVRPEAGGLEVVLSSSQLESLTDALLALMEYPYGCTEQVASRLMAAISMSDVARHIQSERMIDKKAFNELIDGSIKRLEELQRSDGGFGFWPGARRSDRYLSIHVTHALARARNAEYTVAEDAFKRALRYVSQVAGATTELTKGQVGLSLRAYALYALQIAGYPEIKHAAPLLAGKPIEEFPLEALGWMLPTFAEAGQSSEVRRIVKHLSNQLVETAQTAQFKTGYTDGAQVILHSSRRADAVITDALVDADPYNTALPKLVEGLLAARRGGSWATTQENAFALVAIKNYFDSFVSRHPHFDARLWRGEELILEERYRRRTPRQVRASIPMDQLLASGAPTDLVIEKDGVQRLYYRLALRYTEQNPPMRPVSHGFTVARTYEAVDRPDDVVRLDDGRWRMRAGARVRVKVDIVVPIRRYHVALVDRLPAGLEAINPHLAVSAGEAPERRFGCWLPWAWYDHQNLRDDRAEAFAGSLAGGVYSYSYTARATTPGTFVAPAATAEEMYNPETFGATAAEVVVVER